MIKIENVSVMNIENAMRGMRNPLNSWSKNDTKNEKIGANDIDLAIRLRNAGPEHRKYMRQMFISCDITAPLFWWKEFDTYKVGTTANSTSTMHTLHKKELTKEDFSFDGGLDTLGINLDNYLKFLNMLRQNFVQNKDKASWRALVQALPESFNQTRTITLNYEVALNMYNQRQNHKLNEWYTFCKWVETLPYAKELLVGKEKEIEK